MFMTRDEFVGEIVRLTDKTESGSAVFADVTPDNKYSLAAPTCSAFCIVSTSQSCERSARWNKEHICMTCMDFL